jgi:hypothetical protein
MEPIEVILKIIDKIYEIGRPVIILIDNFEYPLISALKGGIIDEAY